MKAPGTTPKRQRPPIPQARSLVRLEYVNPAARSVCIAGDFNDWHPQATEMLKVGEGRWVKELALKPGVYQYRLVVDNTWMVDPGCAESAPNPYGDRNSVLRVGNGP
jgi:1,4-alpha-glucan branching enzyme